MFWILAVADWLAHVLYRPTTLGREADRRRWHHRIHLVPCRLAAWVCDRYEQALGVTRGELGRTG